MQDAWEVIRALLYLVVILMAARWVAANVGQRFRPKTQNLCVVETVGLGSRRAVCLVKSGDRFLVLGVTDGSIRLLDVLTDIEEMPPAPTVTLPWKRGGGDG